MCGKGTGTVNYLLCVCVCDAMVLWSNRPTNNVPTHSKDNQKARIKERRMLKHLVRLLVWEENTGTPFSFFWPKIFLLYTISIPILSLNVRPHQRRPQLFFIHFSLPPLFFFLQFTKKGWLWLLIFSLPCLQSLSPLRHVQYNRPYIYM